ncbi:hypothetical protein D3C87_279430 [compost metagenome]
MEDDFEPPQDKTYLIRFPIGDWGGDGHGKFSEYIVSSNEPVEVLREAHIKFRDMYGVDVSNFCDEDRYYLTAEEAEALETAQIHLNDPRFEVTQSNDHVHPITQDGLFELWLACLSRANPDLELSLEPLPTITTYSGTQGRAIYAPGYGLLD